MNLQDMSRFFESFSICQALPDKSAAQRKSQSVPVESESIAVRQALTDELSSTKTPDKPSQKRQAPPAESKGPLPIDFRSHSHLGWMHFKFLIPINDPLKREFYAAMCRIERWSTRTLQHPSDSMLYERTALSRKPEQTAKIPVFRWLNENGVLR